MNQDTTSSHPPPAANEILAKRKRGRPRKDETLTQQENSHATPKPEDVNLVGQMVSGVVEGSFDAGYFLNVKVIDSDKKLKGFVFLPDRVIPITPENDVAPLAKMYTRKEIKNQNVHQSLPNDQPMNDSVTDLDISESARALSLKPQESNGGFTAQAEEAMIEKDGVTVEEEEEVATRLVEFFPTPETMMTAQTNLVLEQKETEQQKSPGESRGFDLMAEKPVCTGEKVPDELQLELGNKTILSGDNKSNTTETTDPKSSVSKRGFIANLFERDDKKVDCNMEEEATSSVQ